MTNVLKECFTIPCGILERRIFLHQLLLNKAVVKWTASISKKDPDIIDIFCTIATTEASIYGVHRFARVMLRLHRTKRRGVNQAYTSVHETWIDSLTQIHRIYAHKLAV